MSDARGLQRMYSLLSRDPESLLQVREEAVVLKIKDWRRRKIASSQPSIPPFR